MKKTIIGLSLAFLIGVSCRLLNIPLPAPPALIGSLLVCSITLGFIASQKYSQAKSNKNNA